MIKGIDVAKYQGTIDWAKAKADGVQFAILKAINKQNQKEESFERNYKGCMENNIPVGVYNYSYATTTKKAEEDALAMVATIAGKSIPMKVWLDVEDNCQKTLGSALIDIINTYKKVIENAGYQFGIYTGLSFYKSFIRPYNAPDVPLWIARYPTQQLMQLKDIPQGSKKPDVGKDIFAWQYSSKGMVNGIQAKVDLNVLYEENELIENTPELTGNGLAEYAISKLGTPYFYGMKMETLTEAKMANMHKLYPSTVTDAYMQKARDKGLVGKTCVDCSGLIGAYRGKQIGSSQLYSTANKRLSMSDIKDFARGVVLWKQGHVGVYIGDGYCVEAKGINYGTIKSRVSDTKWSCGLTFNDLSYNYTNKIESPEKRANPYTEPTRNLKKGLKGDDVKWLQFELNECGFVLVEDGDFGTKTHNAVIKFQQSCKIEADGIVGKITRSKLKEN